MQLVWGWQGFGKSCWQFAKGRHAWEAKFFLDCVVPFLLCDSESLIKRLELINEDLGFVFLDAEVEKVAEDLRFVLVLQVTFWRTSIDTVRQNIIKTWGFMETCTASFLDNHHVLLHLANKRDHMHAWAQEGRVVAGCHFQLFNWSVNFDVHKEPTTEA